MEHPVTVEISTKNPVTVAITGFAVWRRAWDSNPCGNPQTPCNYSLPKFLGIFLGIFFSKRASICSVASRLEDAKLKL